MPSFYERLTTSPISRELQSAGHWWAGEMSRLFADIRACFPQKSDETIRILFDPTGSNEQAGTLHVTDSEASWTTVGKQVRREDGRPPSLTVMVPETLCLKRTSSYPNVPSNELAGIIGLELATTTPFSKANAAWTWRRREDGKTDVIILKRELIETMRSLAQTAGLILSDVRLQGASVSMPPFESFETPETRRAAFWRKANICLGAGLAALILTLYATSYLQKTAALQDLNAQIAEKTVEARELRATLNEQEKAAEAALALRALKNDRTSVVETWARITTLLPATAWVSELGLGKDGGTIVGFTGNAASLISLLEEDPALKHVAFATAIRIDPLSKAERFDIRFASEPAQ